MRLAVVLVSRKDSILDCSPSCPSQSTPYTNSGPDSMSWLDRPSERIAGRIDTHRRSQMRVPATNGYVPTAIPPQHRDDRMSADRTPLPQPSSEAHPTA